MAKFPSVKKVARQASFKALAKSTIPPVSNRQHLPQARQASPSGASAASTSR